MSTSNDLSPVAAASEVATISTGSGSSSPVISHADQSNEDEQNRTDSDASTSLCLLCLTRPPSAVLLPCCHFNLCHLCAPLLILRNRSSQPELHPAAIRSDSEDSAHSQSHPADSLSSLTSLSSSPNRDTGCLPFNIALVRATANHPKTRRLSSAGYLPEPQGRRGGEFTGEDLIRSLSIGQHDQNAIASPSECGVIRTLHDDGRLELSIDSDTQPAAKCPFCRAGVNGWLRVYCS